MLVFGPPLSATAEPGGQVGPIAGDTHVTAAVMTTARAPALAGPRIQGLRKDSMPYKCIRELDALRVRCKDFASVQTSSPVITALHMSITDFLEEIDEAVATVLSSDFEIEITETNYVPSFTDPGITFDNLDESIKRCKLL